MIFLVRGALIALLCLTYLWFRRHLSGRRTLGRVAAMLLLTAAVVSIFVPGLTTQVANLVGIGRGADLIFYLMIAFLLLSVTILQVRLQQQNRMITALTREFALLTGQSADRDSPAKAAPPGGAQRAE
jgi:small membrane protein